MLSPERRSHFHIIWACWRGSCSSWPDFLRTTESFTDPSVSTVYIPSLNSRLTSVSSCPARLWIPRDDGTRPPTPPHPHPGSLFMYSIVVPDVGNDWESVFWEIACSSVMWGAFINDTDHYSFSLLLCLRQEWTPSTEEAEKNKYGKR